MTSKTCLIVASGFTPKLREKRQWLEGLGYEVTVKVTSGDESIEGLSFDAVWFDELVNIEEGKI